MKIAIVYSSKTGNTKDIATKIAEAIKDDVIYLGEPKKDIDADLFFIGSWTDKGNASNEILDFIATLENKKIAIFGTAGFGGSKEYFANLFDRVCKHISNSNKILGYYYSQGKMPLAVRSRYEALIKANPLDEKLQVSLKNFDEALKHPNEEDFNNAKSFALEMKNKA